MSRELGYLRSAWFVKVIDWKTNEYSSKNILQAYLLSTIPLFSFGWCWWGSMRVTPTCLLTKSAKNIMNRRRRNWKTMWFATQKVTSLLSIKLKSKVTFLAETYYRDIFMPRSLTSCNLYLHIFLIFRLQFLSCHLCRGISPFHCFWGSAYLSFAHKHNIFYTNPFLFNWLFVLGARAWKRKDWRHPWNVF